MAFIHTIQVFLQSLHLNPLLVLGAVTIAGLYAGKTTKFIKLPSIIGFMAVGVLLGPSFLDIMNEEFQQNLSFITDIALSFVAVSIGIELSFKSLKQQGKGIITVIFSESFMAFGIVTTGLYLLTKDLPLSLIFGAIAPASAPAGTVAIIQEYKARGPMTRALYSVVGFDDGLGIIIFGFASAIAKSLLGRETGMEAEGLGTLLWVPIKEILLSVGIGGTVSLLFILLARKVKKDRDLFILIFAFILLSAGLCMKFHTSIILTNMIVGIIIVNTQRRELVERIHHELAEFMPLLFILFFILAGANLHIAALPSLGLLGVVYILGRSAGLIGGASLGCTLGKQPPNLRKYLGLGILSQAGVAIGLSLIVKQEFVEYGAHGAAIGSTVITTITATCLFFEIIGPILTKFGLEKAGEIEVHKKKDAAA